MDRFVIANGIELHVLDRPGAAPPLVLLHGLTANARFFDGLLGAGLARRRQVLAVDLRGRGRSDKPESGYTMAAHAADVIGLLDALELSRVVVGGHSFGALLTLYLAAHFPERVLSGIMIDAAGALHASVRDLIKPSLARLGQVLPSWEAYREQMRQQSFLDGFWDAALEGHYRADVEILPDGTVRARSQPAAIAEAVDEALGEPWSEYVARVTQPFLLINATGSFGPPGAPPILPAEQARDTVEALANGQYEHVGGNHYTMLFGENAVRTVTIIDDFLAEVVGKHS